MSKREPQTMLKTGERKAVLELGLEGNSAQNQRSGTKNRVFLEGDRLEVEVKNGRWVLTHVHAAARRPAPVQHYFPDD